MSRSIHATRKQLRELQQDSYRDEAIKASAVANLEADLDRKRRIKQSLSELRGTKIVESTKAIASPVPIRILDTGPSVLHAVSPADIEAIERRLPAGVMAGLSEIVFSLGEHAQIEGEDAYIWDPDPITNRIGLEMLPGFYAGWIWGMYHSAACRITLHAFVVDPSASSPMPTKVYFKLQALATFVHEVAHHVNHTERVARGRWRADEKEKVETFARNCEHEWTQA